MSSNHGHSEIIRSTGIIMAKGQRFKSYLLALTDETNIYFFCLTIQLELEEKECHTAQT